MANRNNYITGVTDLLILSMLCKRDCYVYEIKKGISTLSNGLLDISQNTLYTAIYKLEDQKFVSEYTKLVGKRRTRVYYHIEPSGYAHYLNISSNYKKTAEGVQNIFDGLEAEGLPIE